MGINFTRVTKNPLEDKDAMVFEVTTLRNYKVLAINPGSTSTKIAVYNGEDTEVELTLRHSAEEISRFPSVIDQYEWRKSLILNILAENNIDINSLSVVIGRGGLLRRATRRCQKSQCEKQKAFHSYMKVSCTIG